MTYLVYSLFHKQRRFGNFSENFRFRTLYWWEPEVRKKFLQLKKIMKTTIIWLETLRKRIHHLNLLLLFYIKVHFDNLLNTILLYWIFYHIISKYIEYFKIIFFEYFTMKRNLRCTRFEPQAEEVQNWCQTINALQLIFRAKNSIVKQL